MTFYVQDKKSFHYDTESERGAETGVVHRQGLFRDYSKHGRYHMQ